MNASLEILSCGPAVTVQDLGRSGYLAQGLTQGGAADVLALHEGAALLGQSPSFAALEMAGMGGIFRANTDTRIALTGAPMAVTIDDAPIAWNASHVLPANAKLKVGSPRTGTFGYLHVGGGIEAPVIMGARATHLSAGLGRALSASQILTIGQDPSSITGMTLPISDRFEGGRVRVVSSMQTEKFDAETISRFSSTSFKRDARGNRMGVRMDHDGDPFLANDQLSILSDVIVSGDIQITGDGAPFVLMCECQTTGGYPRIGTVIPSDLARVAQASAGTPLTFEFIELSVARNIEQRDSVARKALAMNVKPLLRDPHSIRDLLSYQLISGAISGAPTDFTDKE